MSNIDRIAEYFTNTISKDLLELCVGKKIGQGMSRDVYEYRSDHTLIVKFEVNSGSFQNVMEWETWQRVKNVPEISKYFAPCVRISSCGTILLQKKISTALKYPDKLPAYLSDTKRSNYGMYNGNFVCCDYGTHAMIENGMTKRMRKVKWWDCE